MSACLLGVVADLFSPLVESVWKPWSHMPSKALSLSSRCANYSRDSGSSASSAGGFYSKAHIGSTHLGDGQNPSPYLASQLGWLRLVTTCYDCNSRDVYKMFTYFILHIQYLNLHDLHVTCTIIHSIGYCGFMLPINIRPAKPGFCRLEWSILWWTNSASSLL